MLSPTQLTASARRIQAEVDALGLGIAREVPSRPPAPQDYLGFYDRFITSNPLQSATRKLYGDGHYARAVEEAYKCLNHTVKIKSGASLDGVSLMQRVFSDKSPILKFNDLRTSSQRNEQAGYMMILAGCMLGVRNPRAHEHELSDSPNVAMELLIWANHLMRMVDSSKRARRQKRGPQNP